MPLYSCMPFTIFKKTLGVTFNVSKTTESTKTEKYDLTGSDTHLMI